MGLTFVQVSALEQVTSSSLTAVKAFDIGTTLGSLLLAHVLDFAGGVFSVTDTLGNTWAPIGTVAAGVAQTFFAINIGSGANTVTFTSTLNSTCTLFLAEYTGQAAGANPIDQILGANSWTETGTGTVAFGSINTGFTNETLLFFGRNNNTCTMATQDGGTVRSGNNNMMLEDRSVAGVGNFSSAFSTNFSGNTGWGTFFSVKTPQSAAGGSAPGAFAETCVAGPAGATYGGPCYK